jgi:hypothetical protein
MQDAVTGGTGSGGVPTGLPADSLPNGGLPTGGSLPGFTDPSGGTGLTAPSVADVPMSPPQGLDPSALQPLFDAMGVSPECSGAMQDDFQGVLDSIPLTVQSIIDSIISQLPGGGLTSPTQFTDPSSGATVLMTPAEGGQPPRFTAENPPSLPVVDALQKMFTDFQNLCAPTPPSQGGHEGRHSDEGHESDDQHSSDGTSDVLAAPQAPAAAPAAAPAQPATYPGYAPTGGTPDASADPLPLAALGGLVLLSGAAAAGYRMSSYGSRSRG